MPRSRTQGQYYCPVLEGAGRSWPQNTPPAITLNPLSVCRDEFEQVSKGFTFGPNTRLTLCAEKLTSFDYVYEPGQSKVSALSFGIVE